MKCPENMFSDSNKTKCSCGGSFINGPDGQCVCDRGHFYTPATANQPSGC